MAFWRVEVLVHALVPLLDARLVLYQHFMELGRRVKHEASLDEVCMRMMTVPGVGPIAALTFKAAVDDPTRFKRSRAARIRALQRQFSKGLLGVARDVAPTLGSTIKARSVATTAPGTALCSQTDPTRTCAEY